jgi:hypothetical protein
MWQPKSKRKSNLADRGKEAEDAVKAFLTEWAGDAPHKEWNRLVDSKAAMGGHARRTIAAAKADFDFYLGYGPGSAIFGLLEAKSTKHDYRLSRDKVSQLPSLRKRSMCGGVCIVAVLHTELNKWRIVDAQMLATTGDKGSWDLRALPLYDTVGQGLHACYPDIF